MSTKTLLGVIPFALAMGAAMALPSVARQDATRNVPMPRQPAAAPSVPVAASSSMHGTDMSSMSSTQMATSRSAAKPAQSHARHAHASTPASAGSSGKQDMSMPMKPSHSSEMQHLHFGNMIGVRPKPGGLAQDMQGMNMPSMGRMDMASMQGGKPPPGARSPDYSDGYRYTDMSGMVMSDHARLAMLMIDQLEYVRDNHGNNSALLDGYLWYGEDFNKLWLKFEGEQAHGKLEDLRTEALWSHAVVSFWDTQLGVRHDSGIGPDRTWAAFGIEGLAPYWFETQAMFYLGQAGRTAARVSFEYEARFTQRLILQPSLEANWYGRNDPQRGIGPGLSDIKAGLRLRYEIRREFAPYVGVVWQQRFGRTRDYMRAQGDPADDLQFVAGLRLWF